VNRTEGDRPISYCGQCGNPLQEGDRFCGACGAPVLSSPQQAEQVVPRQTAIAQGATTRARSLFVWAVGLGAILVLTLGVSAVFALDLLGGESTTQGGAQTSPDTAPSGTGNTTSALPQDTTAPPLTAEEESTSGLTVPETEESEAAEAEVEEAVEDYYWAVDREDWSYTYSHLDSRSREMFTEEEWYLKNQWYADNENLVLDSIEVGVAMDLGGAGAEVTVYRIFKDGTSITRDTYFVLEEGEWKHRLTEEENEIFMPEASYEEFVAAQQ